MSSGNDFVYMVGGCTLGFITAALIILIVFTAVIKLAEWRRNRIDRLYVQNVEARIAQGEYEPSIYPTETDR